MNWSEKYRPNTIDDLYLTYDNKTKIKKWIHDFIHKKDNFTNCLLLHGPPGVGKTSLANIILETNNFDIIEFNSSDIRNQKTLKEFTKNALKTFEEQRIFNIVNDESIEDEAKLQAFTNSFVKLTELTVGMISTGIVSIQIGEDVVDNRKHIDDFIANADKQFFNSITEHLNSQKEMFAIKPMTVTSSPEDIKNGVPATYEVPITFDQSNFFA